MQTLHQLYQHSFCMLGMHIAPPPRYPSGPVVAECPCCGKTCYFYGLTAYGIGGPPVLTPIAFRVLPVG